MGLAMKMTARPPITPTAAIQPPVYHDEVFALAPIHVATMSQKP